MDRMKKFISGLAIILWVALVVSVRFPATAAPGLQLTPFPTPTPGPDGRILYTVQKDDTLWRISAVSGVSLDELRRINNLEPNEIILPGQILLLGLGGPSLPPTQAPLSTAFPGDVTPTPTPGPGTGTLCVLLYEDVNGDSVRQEDEVSIPGGAVSITDRTGNVSLTADTQPGNEPMCFEEMVEGDYNITMAVPTGYNPTTILNYALKLNAGDTAYIDFGAQEGSRLIESSPPPEEGGKSPVLGIVGGLLLLGGIVLAIFAGRLTRGRKIG